MKSVKSFSERLRCGFITFAQCMIGGDFQKYTTLLVSPGMSTHVDALSGLKCIHKSHARRAGGDKVDGRWVSAEAAAYPAELNLFFAQAFARLVSSHAPRERRDSGPVNRDSPSRA